MASLRHRDISKCWSQWKCSDWSVRLQTALLPHLKLKMFSFSLSVCVWMRPTCWAPVTASSWERRRREQFERCCESCLWKHHFKKKTTTNKQNHNKAAASSGKAEQRDGLSVVVWMEKTAALRTANKLFCVQHLISLSGALLVHLRWSQSKQIWRVACTDWPCSPESF